jgi:hypothetical protein
MRMRILLRVIKDLPNEPIGSFRQSLAADVPVDPPQASFA